MQKLKQIMLIPPQSKKSPLLYSNKFFLTRRIINSFIKSSKNKNIHIFQRLIASRKTTDSDKKLPIINTGVFLYILQTIAI